jgi:hypothetical protein
MKPIRFLRPSSVVLLGSLSLSGAGAWRAAVGAAAAQPGVPMPQIEALLQGRYDNAAQVASGRAEHPPPQHVTITIEPTPKADWQLWHVHMDVEQDIADSAGSDTSLDAVWAMNITQSAHGTQFVPYTLNPSLDATAMKGASFDEAQWFSLAACTLSGEFGSSKIEMAVPPDEMCAAASMGIGGKRAFLPMWVSRESDALRLQITYFGRPWDVDARLSK